MLNTSFFDITEKGSHTNYTYRAHLQTLPDSLSGAAATPVGGCGANGSFSKWQPTDPCSGVPPTGGGSLGNLGIPTPPLENAGAGMMDGDFLIDALTLSNQTSVTQVWLSGQFANLGLRSLGPCARAAVDTLQRAVVTVAPDGTTSPAVGDYEGLKGTNVVNRTDSMIATRASPRSRLASHPSSPGEDLT